MDKEYFVMDDGGMDIPSEEITPEMESVADAIFEDVMKKIQS